MKKSLLALAALTAFAGAASAQSSVTLFGIVDVNVRNVDNKAGDVTSLSTDGINSSRLGFRGVEDLGGGLRAGFWIEGALQPDTGNAGGQTWQRRSTVSLLGSWGEVRLGRDYTPTFWNHTIFDPFGTNGVGSHNNVYAFPGTWSTGTQVRANNTVGYFLPSLGGLYGQVQVAAGEGSNPANKYMGGRIGYGAGPFNVAAAYGKTEKESFMTDDTTEWNVGGSFALSFLTIFGQYGEAEQSTPTAANFNKVKTWLVGVTVPIGAGTIKASYNEGEYVSALASPKATQWAVGYQYDLSKRTALYANVAQLDNDAGLARTVASGAPVSGTGFKSTGYEVGLRHSF